MAGWATPQARDHFPAHTEDYIAAKKAEGHGMSNLNDQAMLGATTTSYPASTEKRGALNPNHSRWLMGFPITWTLCGLLAHLKMKSARRSALSRSFKVELVA
jgi:hypothetical protein